MTHSILKEETLFKRPAYIVLNTKEIVRELSGKLSRTWDWAEDESIIVELFQEILQLITIRENAELSLQYESMGLVQDTMLWRFGAEIDNILDFSRFMVRFGMAIVHQLESIGVYENGIMKYVYHSRLGNDIVLVQAFYNQPNDDHPEPAA